jgi:hypothetical protein
MSVITLGSVELHVQRHGGWDLPPFATAVKILSDGTTTNNETIQAGASPRRRATIAAWLTDTDDLAILDGYNESKEAVTYAEDTDTRSAVVMDLQVDRARPWFYQLTIQLIEADAAASGS